MFVKQGLSTVDPESKKEGIGRFKAIWSERNIKTYNVMIIFTKHI